VPGGGELKGSGTSQASPMVCNLAAKLLALEPGLTTEDLVRLIEGGADAHPEDPSMRRINPRRSVALLER
jgi:hypothetical protein